MPAQLRPSVRPITERDLTDVVAMVHELAAYERTPEQCQLTVEQLRAALLGARPALFGHVAEAGGRSVGFALWFLSFSSWDGVHGIYLEDLYVRPEHRGAGHGRALLAELAAECVRRGYSRLQWSVLDWNTPSIEFYRRLGAEPVEGWTVYRVDGPRLARMASSRESSPGELTG